MIICNVKLFDKMKENILNSSLNFIDENKTVKEGYIFVVKLYNLCSGSDSKNTLFRFKDGLYKR